MGYTGPDARARSLRSGRSNTYGVVFAEKLSYAFTDPYATAWLAGFSEVMEEHAASVVLLSVPAGSPDALAAVQDTALDGLAGLCASNEALGAARARGIPVVVTSASPEGDQVVIDDRQAGLDVAEHVRRLGHTRVALMVESLDPEEPVRRELSIEEFHRLSSDRRDTGFVDSWDRWHGLLDGLSGLDVGVVIAGVNNRASGAAAAPILLDRADRPTAIIAVSDVLALGVLDALDARGLTPGRDVSVAGFDDLPGLSEQAGLTTVRQPIRDNGRLSAELLLDPDRQPRRLDLPHELVVRRSTGPAPRA